ncbi:MAG: response regulator [Proteobacteria bacterium]|nr:response regulator [Pseudomonadota bacterium]
MKQPINILVVDDDKDNAASLGELFELEGYRVQVVHSGEAAIAAFGRENFDIAFMDVVMPGKNGVESFLEIRHLRPDAKVIMMTGYSVEELLQQALAGGALGLLDKPFDVDEVLRLARSVGAGIVVSNPYRLPGNAGQLIHQALSTCGVGCRHVTEAEHLGHGLKPDEVIVLDARQKLIEGVAFYRRVKAMGHQAPTFIVPPACAAPQQDGFRDVAITGVLNKPFDPFDLIERLPVLAAPPERT